MPAQRGLATAIAVLAAEKGDSPALVVDGQSISGADLAAGIETAADKVSGGGVHVVEMHNDVRSLTSFLGGVRAGRVSAVFDPSWPQEMKRDLSAGLKEQQPPRSDGVFFEDPSDDFYIGFTAGSTGRPKGFKRSAQTWIESFQAADRAFGIGPGDTVIALGSLIHSLFLFAVLHSLHLGALTHMLGRFRPNRALQMLKAAERAVVYATPTHLQSLIAEAGKNDVTLPDVKCVLSAGAPLAGLSEEALKQLFPGARLFDFYGASELSFMTYAELGKTPLGSVGQPFPGVDILVLDEKGKACAAGEPGHIFVSTPFVFSGYVNAEDSLRRSGEAVSIGDMGYLDVAGNLYLTGRVDRMIVSAARNVHPEHIEAVLNASPKVAVSAVIGLDDEALGKRLVAAVVIEGDAPPTRSALVSWCRDRLIDGEIPHRFVKLQAMPLTPVGKIDFKAVAEILSSGGGEDIT